MDHPVTACEPWDITKYAAAGQFRNVWSYYRGVSQEREVAYGVEISVRVGGWPRWWLYTSADGII